ncbi:MAG TPA: T9SS type A sorting domain-containing protein [Flavobacteriia bacterium]|nr:T9SS type A sorting domain-containing protein [Flavobacteriia bacterium]
MIQAVRASGHLYANPTDHEGYGIPNFETALSTLAVNAFSEGSFKVYPNPFQERIQFQFTGEFTALQVSLFDLLGRKLLEKQVTKQHPLLDVAGISKGIYILRIAQQGVFRSVKMVKE